MDGVDGGAPENVKLNYVLLLQMLESWLTGTGRYPFSRLRQNVQKQELAHPRAKKGIVSAEQTGYTLDPAPDACK